MQALALPPEGAAQALNIPRSAVYRLIAQARQGDPDGLPSIKIGKRRLVPVSALEAFIERRLQAAL
jgi:excisionase family DNA binding protein